MNLLWTVVVIGVIALIVYVIMTARKGPRV